jgi:hypothetical protein
MARNSIDFLGFVAVGREGLLHAGGLWIDVETEIAHQSRAPLVLVLAKTPPRGEVTRTSRWSAVAVGTM